MAAQTCLQNYCAIEVLAFSIKIAMKPAGTVAANISQNR